MRTIESYRQQILDYADHGILGGFFNVFETIYHPIENYRIYLINFSARDIHAVVTILMAMGFVVHASANNAVSSSNEKNRIYWDDELGIFTQNIEELDNKEMHGCTLLEVGIF